MAGFSTSVVNTEEIEHRAKQDEHRDENHYAAYHLIYYDDACVLKFVAYLVNQPGQAIPPQQCPADNAQITNQP